mmetsp:Transcript_37130/g.86779  ORF Transcript_37130/g.86779 Transcript_37130/m.86779 type:complete len:230 (-) Transcript_37130:925-1614(-)
MRTHGRRHRGDGLRQIRRRSDGQRQRRQRRPGLILGRPRAVRPVDDGGAVAHGEQARLRRREHAFELAAPVRVRRRRLSARGHCRPTPRDAGGAAPLQRARLHAVGHGHVHGGLRLPRLLLPPHLPRATPTRRRPLALDAARPNRPGCQRDHDARPQRGRAAVHRLPVRVGPAGERAGRHLRGPHVPLHLAGPDDARHLVGVRGSRLLAPARFRHVGLRHLVVLARRVH